MTKTKKDYVKDNFNLVQPFYLNKCSVNEQFKINSIF